MVFCLYYMRNPPIKIHIFPHGNNLLSVFTNKKHATERADKKKNDDENIADSLDFMEQILSPSKKRKPNKKTISCVRC